MSLGVVVALFALYQVTFSNVLSDTKASSIAASLRERLEAPEDAGTTNIISETSSDQTAGLEGLALLYIPRLRSDVWGTPILEGTSYEVLASGVGHYRSTELPGETGNFAVAGHRASNGEPFARFEKLQSGDLVYVRSSTGWFTYELFQDQKISKDGVWVLDDRPRGVLGDSNQLMTLTTCDPRWNSTQRWAWWGKLIYAGPDAPKELTN